MIFELQALHARHERAGTAACLGGNGECLRWLRAPGRNLLKKMFHVAFDRIRFLAINFIEYQRKRESELQQPLNKFEVNALWAESGIENHIGAGKAFATTDVFGDDIMKKIARLLADFGVTVAGEVDEAPLLVEDEIIDQFRVSWGSRDLCKVLFSSKHIDQRRLSDVRSPNQSAFRHRYLGTFGESRGTEFESSRFDAHEKMMCDGVRSSCVERVRFVNHHGLAEPIRHPYANDPGLRGFEFVLELGATEVIMRR